MLIDDIKKAKMDALKAHDPEAQVAYSVVMNKYLMSSIELRKENKTLSDSDTVCLIQKTMKELEEERDMYLNNGREEKGKDIQHQMDVLKGFLPTMMSEDEIRKIIESLADKSVKNVMITFKTKYPGKADMSLVSALARSYQGK